MKRFGKALLGTTSLILTITLAVSYQNNRQPYSAAHAEILVDKLFEFGSVSFVHDRYQAQPLSLDLFACVQEGRTLSPAQSVFYRRRFEEVLRRSQTLFGRLDQNLQLRRDYHITDYNNVGSHGVTGLHDLHDLSAIDNLADIDRDLKRLAGANPFRRTMLANGIYKDLTDLMVHLAPAVHSVGMLALEPILAEIDPALAELYQVFYEAMKTAQGAAINSTEYWQSIDAAKAAYLALVLHVQEQVWAANGSVLHAVSGRWLAVQTIAPFLTEASPASIERQGNRETLCAK